MNFRLFVLKHKSFRTLIFHLIHFLTRIKNMQSMCISNIFSNKKSYRVFKKEKSFAYNYDFFLNKTLNAFLFKKINYYVE